MLGPSSRTRNRRSGGRDEVDRAAHQPRPHDRPIGDRRVDVGLGDADRASPNPEPRLAEILGLDRDCVRRCVGDRRARTVDEAVPRHPLREQAHGRAPGRTIARAASTCAGGEGCVGVGSGQPRGEHPGRERVARAGAVDHGHIVAGHSDDALAVRPHRVPVALLDDGLAAAQPERPRCRLDVARPGQHRGLVPVREQQRRADRVEEPLAGRTRATAPRTPRRPRRCSRAAVRWRARQPRRCSAAGWNSA